MPQVIPGAQPVYESQSVLNGIVATCVEAAGAVITGIYGVLPASANTTRRLALDLQAKGQAGPGGATSSLALQPDLARLGIPSTWHNSGERGNFFNLINQALGQGKPVLIGVTNASALQDAYTGARPDLGVQNHGLTIVGANARGYLVADPNTAPGSGFMTYSAADLQQAQLDTLLIPNEPPPSVQQYAGPGQSAGGPLSGLTNWASSLVANNASNAASAPSSSSTGGGFSLLNFDPQQLGQQFIAGVEGQLQDAAIRGGLILLGVVLLVLGLIFFFTLGGGRGTAAQAGSSYAGGFARARGERAGKGGGAAGDAGEAAGGAGDAAAAAAV